MFEQIQTIFRQLLGIFLGLLTRSLFTFKLEITFMPSKSKGNYDIVRNVGFLYIENSIIILAS